MIRKTYRLSDDSEISLPPEEVVVMDADTHPHGGEPVDKKAGKQKQEKNPAARSTETLFRNAVRSNLDLTSIADNKANIMISINGIIISILIASIAPSTASQPASTAASTLAAAIPLVS